MTNKNTSDFIKFIQENDGIGDKTRLIKKVCKEFNLIQDRIK
tara:strand:+ start:97 stop:222 length:126 start_codon:yes stop_codon:yes gene_type:complete